MKPKKMWMIVAPPQKMFYLYTLSWTKKEAIRLSVDNTGYSWEDLMKYGHKCIKVTITEGWEAREA